MLNRRTALLAAATLPSAAALGVAHASQSCGAQGRIRLACGRRLGYAEHGNPAGPLVLYFHGTPGSRLDVGVVNEEALAAGVRLIALERPGIGLSDYDADREILDWPADVAAAADALGGSGAPFGVIALSGGAPYALACVCRMPRRLTHVAVVSGHAPMDAPGTCRGNQDELIDLVTRRPHIATLGFKVASGQLHRKPQHFLEKVSASWSPADRQMVMCRSDYRAAVIDTLHEATRCGSAGISTDVRLLGSPWGICLDRLPPAPISIWHGGCDPIAPISMAHYFHRQLAGSELIVDHAAGHLTMIKWHAAEILARFASAAPPALAIG